MPEEIKSVKNGKVTKAKRTRVNFTSAQLEAFEAVFAKSQYPDVIVLEKLAEGMDLGIEKICTWFQNRRSKFRRASKKGHIDWMRQRILATGTQREDNHATNGKGTSSSSTSAPPVMAEKTTVSSVLSAIKGPSRCAPNTQDFMDAGFRHPTTPTQTRMDYASRNATITTSSAGYHHMPIPSLSTFPPMYPPGASTNPYLPASASLLAPPPLPSQRDHQTTTTGATSYSDANYQLSTWTSHYPSSPPTPTSQSSSTCHNSIYASYPDYTYPSLSYMNMTGTAQNLKYESTQLSSAPESSSFYSVNAPSISGLSPDPIWTSLTLDH